MADLIDVLHQITQENMKGRKLTDLCFGTVASAAPLSIQLETTMQPIPAEAIVLTDAVRLKTTELEIDGETYTITLSEALRAGERVTMLRCSAGQRFIVLSRAEQEA